MGPDERAYTLLSSTHVHVPKKASIAATSSSKSKREAAAEKAEQHSERANLAHKKMLEGIRNGGNNLRARMKKTVCSNSLVLLPKHATCTGAELWLHPWRTAARGAAFRANAARSSEEVWTQSR